MEFEIVNDNSQVVDNPVDNPVDNSVDNPKSADDKPDIVNELTGRVDALTGKVDTLVDAITKATQQQQQLQDDDDDDDLDLDYLDDNEGGNMAKDNSIMNEDGELDPAKLDKMVTDRATEIASKMVNKTETKFTQKAEYDRQKAFYDSEVFKTYPEMFEDGHVLRKEGDRIYNELSKDPSYKDRPDLMRIVADRAFSNMARSGKLQEVSLKKREALAAQAGGLPRGRSGALSQSTEPSDRQKVVAGLLGVDNDKVKDIVKKFGSAKVKVK